MSRARAGLASALLCLAVSGCSGLAASSQEEQATPPSEVTAPPAPTPTPTPEPMGVEDVLGEDGRLTVLILGTDLRKGIAGERTDTIMIAGMDPESGKVTMVSLPRDTVNVPVAADQVYGGRINTLYFEYQRSGGKKKALKKLREALSYAFDVEIDYYALVDFTGLVRLVNSVGGIEVTLEEAFSDPSMHIGRNGLQLKAGRRKLDGKTALAYARSRHADSDYDRSRRQQQVLAAAADKVRRRGIEALPALVALARKKIITDIPPAAAPVMLELAGRAQLGSPKSMVLAPSRWARPGPQLYTIAPKVEEIRKMFARVFRPLS